MAILLDVPFTPPEVTKFTDAPAGRAPIEAKVSAALPPLFVDCTVELPLRSVRPVMPCNAPAALFTLNVPLPDKNNAEPVTPFKLPVVPLPMFKVPPVIVTFVAPVVPVTLCEEAPTVSTRSSPMNSRAGWLLAATSIGAVWSSASIEFGARTVIDRFSQIAPKVLIAADGYRFSGKAFDRRPEVAEIAQALPTLEALVWVPQFEHDPQAPVAVSQVRFDALLDTHRAALDTLIAQGDPVATSRRLRQMLLP